MSHHYSKNRRKAKATVGAKSELVSDVLPVFGGTSPAALAHEKQVDALIENVQALQQSLSDTQRDKVQLQDQISALKRKDAEMCTALGRKTAHWKEACVTTASGQRKELRTHMYVGVCAGVVLGELCTIVIGAIHGVFS